jgi:hypothetical protein
VKHNPAKKNGIAKEEYMIARDIKAEKEIRGTKGTPKKTANDRMMEIEKRSAARVSWRFTFSTENRWGNR